MTSPESDNVYKRNGYESRKDYLKNLADEYGLPYRTVVDVAETLGPEEDFDALVTTLSDLE
ncbi:MAG TPA: RNA polymerase [Planctomycetaceae bacterium]|nr:RNA polymerase [Planctomycetaceae bacterium]